MEGFRFLPLSRAAYGLENQGAFVAILYLNFRFYGFGIADLCYSAARQSCFPSSTDVWGKGGAGRGREGGMHFPVYVKIGMGL